jgi:hypothetical protein
MGGIAYPEIFNGLRDAEKIKYPIYHPLFRPYLPDPQDQDPRKRMTIPVVLRLRIKQISPKYVRYPGYFVFSAPLNFDDLIFSLNRRI